MLNSPLALTSGGSWSVGHGVIERYPALALPRSSIDPRDCAAYGAVKKPQFKVPERPRKLDPFAERLSAWLQREMSRPRKQKRTMKQLHACHGVLAGAPQLQIHDARGR